MKTSLALALTALFSLSASATELVSVSVNTYDGKKSVSFDGGFTEDGFSSPLAACYLGDVKDVCGLVKKASQEAMDLYTSGAHGTFEVKSCAVDGQAVKLSYEQINDYGPSKILATTIVSCRRGTVSVGQ